MKLRYTGTIAALALFAGAQAASAQGIQLRGVRADAQVGIDRFYSEGNNDNHLAYGAALGVDTFVGDNFVLGLEGTFLNSRAENITLDGPGIAARKSFEEWGGAIRAGTMISPRTAQEYQLRENGAEDVLVVCPASLLGNWEAEIRRLRAENAKLLEQREVLKKSLGILSEAPPRDMPESSR